MPRHGSAAGAAPAWTRRKMVTLLAACAAVAALLVAGLVLAIVTALAPHRTHAAVPAAAGNGGPGLATAPNRPHAAGAPDDAVPSVRAQQDALAAMPMPAVDDDAAKPGPVSTRDPSPALTLPDATASGPAGVATGFPHTELGAMAQLAAIDQTALQSGSLSGARAVITAWAQPGGPTASSWSGVAALGQLLDAAGLSGGGSPQLSLLMTPLMGLVKASLGPDWVIPCVDFELDATLSSTARAGVADCQRMTWAPDPTAGSTSGAAEGRWMIAAGAEPAEPPSVWPDTDRAYAVGYRDLTHG